MCIRDRGYPPCTPGGGPRPWYTCKVDLDCIACDSPEFYSAFCDNSTNDGACHFNNWWQGVRLIHGPTDDMDMFHMADDGSCHVLNVYSGNTRYQCWEDWWPKHGKEFADWKNGSCPTGYSHQTSQQSICQDQGAPTSTVTVYSQTGDF
eukprot:TRINITY_DN1591_c0_g1_i7.p1 TRINITY_DN1591_c0_g1~~TRINITY_DN1591_c0_g1_i7.p1  ORF type:complete len:149 (+),score=38.78 TRINITY_DN1591_c0_g1_i7:182-628(+)